MGGAIIYTNLITAGKTEDALKIFNFFVRLSAVISFAISIFGFIFEENLLIFLGADPNDFAVYALTKEYIFYILLGIPFNILMGVLCTYLRNDDADTFSIVVQSASGALNLFLSALLIFYFDWGIGGCSFSYFLSNFLAVLILIGYIIFRKGGTLSFKGETISFQESIKPLRLGFATSIEYIFNAIFTLISIHILIEIDGNEGVAVFNVIENLAQLFIFIYEFIGKTSQPLFSTFFAEKNFAEMRRVFKYALIYSLTLGILSAVLVIFYPQILNLLFGLDNVTDVSKVYYAAKVFCIGSILMGICLLLQNYLQSSEDEKSAFLVVFMRRTGASIPLAYILASFGFNAFWLVYPLSEIVTLITLYFYKRRKFETTEIETDRIYTATFTNTLEDLETQFEAIKIFAARRKADKHKSNTLRLVVEEVWALLNDTNKKNSVLIQITIFAKLDGTFQLTMRHNGKLVDNFKEMLEDKNIFLIGDEIKPTELKLNLLKMAKSYSNQFLYRKHYDFNTITVNV